MKDFISAGKAVMGIEFGSTRIKAVLIGDDFKVIAQGAHDWENRLVDGVWSYSLEDIEAGVRGAYAKCAADAEAKCGAKLTRLTEEVCAARPAPGLVPYVGEKHYQRKHGKNAYYGQGGR